MWIVIATEFPPDTAVVVGLSLRKRSFTHTVIIL